MRQYFIDCTKGPSALIYIINNNVCVMRVFPSLCNSSSRMCVVGTSINHVEFLTSQRVLRGLNNGFSLSVVSGTSTNGFIFFSIFE